MPFTGTYQRIHPLPVKLRRQHSAQILLKVTLLIIQLGFHVVVIQMGCTVQNDIHGSGLFQIQNRLELDLVIRGHAHHHFCQLVQLIKLAHIGIVACIDLRNGRFHFVVHTPLNLLCSQRLGNILCFLGMNRQGYPLRFLL